MMRRRVFSALVPLALALALAGCGADEPGAGPATGGASATPSLDAHAKGVKFAQCMREHGIDMADPEPGKGVLMKFDNVDRATVEKAMEACREWAPQGANGGAPDPKQQEAMRKFAQCMRDNGVESFPDPEGGGIRLDQKTGDDPDFKAAQEKCSKEFLPGLGS